MQELKELVNIITKQKTKHLDLFGSASNGLSTVSDFYDALTADAFGSDDEAAIHYYGTTATHINYRKLKTKLKNRLINGLFMVDLNQPSYNDRQKAYYESYKEWAAVKILLGKHARCSALSLCYKILQNAQKYEFTELTLDVARTLKLHYSIWEGDVKKYNKYKELFKKHEEIWQLENLAEEMYSDLIINYVNRKSTKKKMHTKAKQYYLQLQNALNTHDSYRLQFCGRLIELLMYTSLNDYAAAAKVNAKSIAFFQQKPYTATTPIQIFLHEQLVAHILLKQYEEGAKVVEQALKLHDPGSFNWFKHKELSFLLAMHTKEYANAQEIFCIASTHPNLPALPETTQEMWKIYEAYLNYLVETGNLLAKKGQQHDSSFKIGKFLNEIPVFSMDKRGMNITILVIQLMYILLHRQYDEAIDRMEAIKKYRTRYLGGDELFRSNCFIRMLLQVPKSNFNRTEVKEKTKKYVQQLQAVPLELANQAYDIEVIPYEELWKLVLDSLKT